MSLHTDGFEATLGSVHQKTTDKEKSYRWHISDAKARPVAELRTMLARLKSNR